MTLDQMAELAARLRVIAPLIPIEGCLAHEITLHQAADLIEQMAQAEPVGWMWQHDETGRFGFVDQWNLDNGWANQNPRCRIVGAIYSAPPAREPLSEEQVMDLVRDNCGVMRWPSSVLDIARAVEQAHGIRSEK